MMLYDASVCGNFVRHSQTGPSSVAIQGSGSELQVGTASLGISDANFPDFQVLQLLGSAAENSTQALLYERETLGSQIHRSNRYQL